MSCYPGITDKTVALHNTEIGALNGDLGSGATAGWDKRSNRRGCGDADWLARTAATATTSKRTYQCYNYQRDSIQDSNYKYVLAKRQRQFVAPVPQWRGKNAKLQLHSGKLLVILNQGLQSVWPVC